MMNFFRRLFGLTDTDDDNNEVWVSHNLETGKRTKLAETDEGKLFQMVGPKNTCPDCGGKGFYEGPSGGMSTNIFCMNRDCRSGFNITWFTSKDGTCERIHQGDLERYPKEKANA